MPKPMGFRQFEALDFTARRKLAMSLKRNKAKIAIGRKKAERRVANVDVLKKRAQKQARMQFFQKITKDIPKDELTFNRRKEVEKRLDKLKPRIQQVAKKMLPQLRQKEMEKRKGKQSDD